MLDFVVSGPIRISHIDYSDNFTACPTGLFKETKTAHECEIFE